MIGFPSVYFFGLVCEQLSPDLLSYFDFDTQRKLCRMYSEKDWKTREDHPANQRKCYTREDPSGLSARFNS